MDLNAIDFQTGDLLLFSENSNIFSRLIKYFTHSIYSHCAIILKSPTYIDPKLTGTYILESNYEPYPDAENNIKYKYGVQIQELTNIIKNYDGQIFWRKLNDTNKTHNFNEKMKEIYNIVKNKPYDINPIDWLKAEFNLNIGNVQQTTSFWCSALVVYIYVKLQLLPPNIHWDLIAPCELSFTGDLQNKFINCSFDNEIQINT